MMKKVKSNILFKMSADQSNPINKVIWLLPGKLKKIEKIIIAKCIKLY